MRDWRILEILKNIGKIRPDEALEILEELARDKKYSVRGYAADSLGEIGKYKLSKALEILKKLINDEHDWVRGYAECSINSLEYYQNIHSRTSKNTK